MKILLKGKHVKDLYKVGIYTIKCTECECLFEAQDTELHHSGGFTLCNCPCCHKEIIVLNNCTYRIENLPMEDIVKYDCSIHKKI